MCGAALLVLFGTGVIEHRLRKGKPMTETKAMALFDARRAVDEAEDAIEEALRESIEFVSFTCDEYDNSIEIMGVGDTTLTEEQLHVIWSLGFSRCWTHRERKKYSMGEKHYWLRSEPKKATP